MPLPLVNTENSEVKAPNPKTADDIAEFLKETDEKVEKEDKSSKRSKSDKEDDIQSDKEKEEDSEIELKEPETDEEEKLDLETKDDDLEISAPPRKKEILEKFPELFKTFPFLEKVLYRDKQYTELFGSFDDAKAIAEKAEVFNEFESQLLSGNTEEVLKNVKETDPKAFDKIVDGYLKTLHKVDKEAYFEVVGNVSKQLIQEMASEAKKSNNDELAQAALLINQFLFGTSEFTPAKSRVEPKSEEASEAEKERLAFVQERFESSRDELQSRSDNTLRATITDYIDPRGIMTAYIKKNAIADSLRYLGESLSSDTTFQSNLDRLWRAAFTAKFSRESLGKIQSFYLGRAKSHLPSAIKKARAEALKELAPRAKVEKEDVEIEEETPRRGKIPTGHPAQIKTGKNQMKPGESVADFFNRD